MKRLIILILLMSVLVACGSTKEADEEVKEESDVEEIEVQEEEKEDSKEIEESKDDPVEKEDSKDEPKEDSKDDPVEKEESSKDKPKEDSKDEQVEKEEDNTKDDKQETETKPEADKEPTEKPEKEPVVKNEKAEVAAENIIWAQNDRDYSVLKSYLGQNITLNEKNNMFKITNVDYPHDAELLKGIKKEDLEHRFTHEDGKDHIVGFAALDHDREMSYTIDLTMRVGKDSWKMLNMQINK